MDDTRCIKITMLGGFEMLYKGKSVAELERPGKMQRLIQYLIIKNGKQASHEELAHAIWPDAKDAASALRTMLHRYRKISERYGPELKDCIVTNRGAYAWFAGDCFVDIYEFKKSVRCAQSAGMKQRAQHCARAAELYKGSLLPMLNAEWTHAPRFESSEMYISAVLMLSDIFRSGGEYKNAEQLCKNAMDIAGSDGRLDAEAKLARSAMRGEPGEGRLKKVRLAQLRAAEELNRISASCISSAVCDCEALECAAQLMRESGADGMYLAVLLIANEHARPLNEQTELLLEAAKTAMKEHGGLAARQGAGVAMLIRGDERAARDIIDKTEKIFQKGELVLASCIRRI